MTSRVNSLTARATSGGNGSFELTVMAVAPETYAPTNRLMMASWLSDPVILISPTMLSLNDNGLGETIRFPLRSSIILMFDPAAIPLRSAHFLGREII
jgi:hypothetical protein